VIETPSRSHELLRRQREVLFPALTPLYGEHPIVVDRARDQYVWDIEGQRYLDFFGGVLTVSVGHCNPEVSDAMVAQLQRVQHTSTLYLHELMVQVAEKVAAITPGRLQRSFFTSSGSEANELAVMAARMYTGQRDVITLRHAYAGRTATAMSLTGHGTWRLGGVFDGSIKHVRNPYAYRAPAGLDADGLLDLCVQDLEETLATVTDGRIAAFMAEPIQGVGGFIVAPREYFRRVLPLVREAGGLLIIDEVQTGWGRTGRHWCAVEHWGRGARRHDLRQGHGQRRAHRLHRRHPGGGRGRARPDLRHLRGQPRQHGRGPGDASVHRAPRPPEPRRAHGFEAVRAARRAAARPPVDR